ncbi:MAG: glycosyltransferase family 2 protein [Acidobacteriota bacterium]
MVPELSAVVIHWRDEDHLERLVRAWPEDPRFELVVVDNGSDGSLDEILRGRATAVIRQGNLGFAGGVNAGVERACSERLLILNPDLAPAEETADLTDALEALLTGFETYPDAAGLVPRLVDLAGEPQTPWQLRRLPSLGDLMLQACFFAGGAGPDREPSAGSPVEQPAAAALALRRRAFEEVGGFDPEFFPAWFEDVDFAQRLQAAGHVLVYHPAATFRHALGATVSSLGYGSFLWIYYRNLMRYTTKHFGEAAAAFLRIVLPVTALLRCIALPLRRPRRAVSRWQAAEGLRTLALGVVSRWRRPESLRRRYGVRS